METFFRTALCVHGIWVAMLSSILNSQRATDFESGWGGICKINKDPLHIIWTTEVFGFNVGEPLYLGGYLYISSIGSIGKIDIKTGEYQWEYHDLYDSLLNIAGRKQDPCMFTSFEKAVAMDSLVIFRSPSCVSSDTGVLIINRESGKLIRIGTVKRDTVSPP